MTSFIHKHRLTPGWKDGIAVTVLLLIPISSSLLCGNIPAMSESISESALSALLSLLSLFTAAYMLVKKTATNIGWNSLDGLLLLLFTFSCLQSMATATNLLSWWQDMTVEGSIAAVYFLVRYYEASGLITLRHIFFSLLCWGCLQVLTGWLQVTGVCLSGYDNGEATGCFLNPAPYAICLGTLLPFMYRPLFLKQRGKYRVPCIFLSAVLSIAAIGLIVRSGSRAACVAVCSSLLVCLLPALRTSGIRRWLNGRWRYLIASFTPLLLVFACFLVYAIRPASANGRAHIWAIAGRMACHHWFLGTGPKGFSGAFLEAQSAYLAVPAHSSGALFLTSGVRYAFNDWLQLACERGILILLVAIVLAGRILTLLCRTIFSPAPSSPDNPTDRAQSHPKAPLVYVASALTVLFVASLFSYPMCTLPLRVLLMILLAVVARHAGTPGDRRPHIVFSPAIIRITIAMIFFSGMACCLFSLLQLREYRQFYAVNLDAPYDEPPAARAGALQHFSRLLHAELYYQQPLVKALEDAGDRNGEQTVLEEEMRLFPEPEGLCRLATLYGLTGHLQEEEALYFSTGRAFPLLLRPDFCLARFYYSHGDRLRGRYYAQKVLSKEPKVTNSAVAIMRSSAQALLRLDN